MDIVKNYFLEIGIKSWAWITCLTTQRNQQQKTSDRSFLRKQKSWKDTVIIKAEYDNGKERYGVKSTKIAQITQAKDASMIDYYDFKEKYKGKHIIHFFIFPMIFFARARSSLVIFLKSKVVKL